MTEEDIFDDSMYERYDQCNDSDWEEYNAEEIYEFGGVAEDSTQPSKSTWQDLIEALLYILLYFTICGLITYCILYTRT